MRGVDQPKGWSLPFLFFLVFNVEDNFFILYTYYHCAPFLLTMQILFASVSY